MFVIPAIQGALIVDYYVVGIKIGYYDFTKEGIY
jgi:hypothetical protein